MCVGRCQCRVGPSLVRVTWRLGIGYRAARFVHDCLVDRSVRWFIWEWCGAVKWEVRGPRAAMAEGANAMELKVTMAAIARVLRDMVHPLVTGLDVGWSRHRAIAFNAGTKRCVLRAIFIMVPRLWRMRDAYPSQIVSDPDGFHLPASRRRSASADALRPGLSAIARFKSSTARSR